MERRLNAPINHSIQTVIQMVSVLYLLVWSVAPPLQMDLIFRLLALGLAFVWFVIEFLRHFEFTMMQIWCALFMFAVAAIGYFSRGFDGVMSEIAVYMMVLAFFINIYSTDNWQSYRIVVPITLGLLCFFNFRTYSALVQDTTLARRLVRDSEELYVFMRQGVGGYGLVYPQVCIAPVVYAWALKSFEHNKFYTLLGAVWSVSFWMVLNLAGYSIAIITSAIALVVLLFYRRQSVLPAFFIAAGLILAMVLLLVYVEGFRNLVLQIFEGTKIVRKIEDLLSTAEGETADSFATRAERYWWSLESCLQYPLIGGRLFGARIGGHSELLDTFAQYGVWGGVPVAFMIFYTPNAFKASSPSITVRATANAHIMAISLFSLFDPFVFQVYFPLMVLCPIMYSDIYKWRTREYEYSLDSQSDSA